MPDSKAWALPELCFSLFKNYTMLLSTAVLIADSDENEIVKRIQNESQQQTIYKLWKLQGICMPDGPKMSNSIMLGIVTSL